MGKVDSLKTAYLALEELAPNPILARRLPADLAWRYHALLLSEDSGRVTVAMANPDDAAARQAIASIVGPTPCLVRSDPKAIDACLATIWADETHELHAAVCDLPRPVSQGVWDYAQALSERLGAGLDRSGPGGALDAWTGGQLPSQYNLLVFEDAECPLIGRVLSEGIVQPSTGQQAALPLAVLVAQQPRWPIKEILLIIQGGVGDAAVVDWMLNLAGKTQSTVTVLAVVPPVPAMYGRRVCRDSSLPALLAADSPLGRQMRQVARHLVDWGIEGKLRLRQGPPDWQIACEVAESDCDLVAVAAQPHAGRLHRLGEDLAHRLLHGCSRPVLVARPKTT